MKLRNRLPFFLRLLNKIRTLFGIPPLTLTNAKAGNLLGLTAYGGLEQNGTPTPDNPIPLICNNGEIKVDANGNVYCDGLQETLRIVESNSTATTEMLLKLGDYVDSQDILNGIINRQLGVLVLKGDENWRVSAYNYIKSDACNAWSYFYSFKLQNVRSAIGYGNKLKINNADIWKLVGYPNTFAINDYQLHINIANDVLGIADYTQETTSTVRTKITQYLKSQYDNGTPLIFVLPLVSESQESTTPQSLTAVEGDNTLEIQQSSLSNLEVEATYEEK